MHGQTMEKQDGLGKREAVVRSSAFRRIYAVEKSLTTDEHG
jgi:hypothetical protein